jgi:heme A synthase
VSKRHFTLPPDLFVWLYVLAAPLVGPAIFLGGISLTRGGGDACDSSYRGDWATRDSEFRAAQLVHVIGSGAMIALGIVLVGLLLARRRRIGTLRAVLAVAATAVVLVGYVLIIAASGYSTDWI